MGTVNVQLLQNYPQKTTASPDVPFTIRAMQKDEASDIVSLLYDCYGDSYCYKRFYDPVEIVRENENGYLLSLVAVTDIGEVIGHGALLRTIDDPQIVEPVMALVKPSFRNYGVLTKLGEYLFVDRKPELFRGVTGMYVSPVTNHVFSQKQVYRHGFKDCGILLEYAPHIEFKGLNTEQTQERLTLVIAYMYIIKPETTVIYPPRQHTAMIISLFHNVGNSRLECRNPEKIPTSYLNGEPILKEKTDDSLGQAVIKIVRYGRNIVPLIKSKISDFCSQRYSVIHLYLSLNDPLTYYLTSEFEEMGFFLLELCPEPLVVMH